MEHARFRYNVSICLAGVLAFLGAIPLATAGFDNGDTPEYAYVLLLLLLIPLAVAVWGWRAGTDADSGGLRVRALFGSRHIAWTDIVTLAPSGRRVYVQLTDGRTVRLVAVGRDDLPKLVAASGEKITSDRPVREPEAAAADGAAEEGAEAVDAQAVDADGTRDGAPADNHASVGDQVPTEDQ